MNINRIESVVCKVGKHGFYAVFKFFFTFTGKNGLIFKIRNPYCPYLTGTGGVSVLRLLFNMAAL